MAEWLRREIRNLLGSPRAGSNPVRSELFELYLCDFTGGTFDRVPEHVIVRSFCACCITTVLATRSIK